MAITFVNKGTWAAGTTSISPGIPASMAAGDFMILQVHTCNQAVTTPSGWTAVTNSPVSTGTANTAGGTRVSVYYRFWQSGDAAPACAVTGGTVTNGIIVGYRGVNSTTPFDATPVATTLATASTSLVMTGITTATNNALIHWAIARDQDLASTTEVTAFVNANLTGITETHDQVVSTGVGGGIWTGRGFKATVGATGNTTITQTSSIAVGLTIALRPAPNNYPLTALGGSYSLTGTSATLTYTPYKPILISTVQLTLGSSATPGAQAVTVPSDAQAVVILSGVTSTNTPTNPFLSLTSSFAGTFTVTNPTNNRNIAAVGYAVVNSTGSQTITPVWNETVQEGPTFWVLFIKNINPSDFVRSVGVNATGAGTGNATTTINSSGTDLLLAIDTQDVDIPTTISGYTSLGSAVVLGSLYEEGSRIQQCNSPGTSTTTVTGTGTVYAAVAAISLKYGVPTSGYTLTAQGGSYTVTGSSVGLRRSKYMYASGGTYSLTGQQATITWTAGAVNYAFTLLGGTYALTGSNAVVSRNRKLTSIGGSYSLVGANATLLRSKRLVSSGGSYAYTGQSATLKRSKYLLSSGGSYTLNGSQAVITRSRLLTAQGGTYTYQGAQATITYGALASAYTLTCLGGSYAVAGVSAQILRSKHIGAVGGSYSISGQSLTLLRSKILVGSGGVYTITGQQAIINRNRLLTATSGLYSLTGSSAILTKASAGGYPAETDVRLGVVYGASGEYTGTLDVGKKFRLDIATGNVVMVLDGGKVMTL